MSVETTLVTELLAYAPLSALVGTRLAPDKVVQGAPRPYIVYVVEREPTHLLDGSVASTFYRVSFQCWADTRAGCEELADALEAALALSTVEGPVGGLPTESRNVITEHELDLEGSEIVTEFWIDT
jgi:hypothetical protein